VAADAQDRGVEFCRSHSAGIGRVLRLRSVTGLAIHMGMLAGLLGVGDVDVTSLTCFMAGKMGRSRSDFSDRGGAIVPVFAEGRRNNVPSNRPEKKKGDNKKRPKAE